MQRNLDRRVETLFPVEDPTIKTVIRQQILDLCLADTVKARQLNPDGAYTWVKPDSEHPLLDSQHSLLYNRSPMVTY